VWCRWSHEKGAVRPLGLAMMIDLMNRTVIYDYPVDTVTKDDAKLTCEACAIWNIQATFPSLTCNR